MKKRKILALVVALVIAAGVTACKTEPTDPTATPTPAPTPVPTLEPEPEEVVFLLPGDQGAENTGLNEALKEIGVKLTVQKYPKEQYRDKIGLLTTSGVRFDLFSFTEDMGSLTAAAAQNMLSSFAPSAELTALFPEAMWKQATVDGLVYGLPVYYREPNGFQNYVGYRADYLKKAGYEEFPQEYFISLGQDMLNAITPEGEEMNTYTWLGKSADVPLWLHGRYDSYPFSVDNFMNLIKVTEKGKVSSFYESEEFRKDAETYRLFYTNGLSNDKIAKGGNKAIATGNILASQGFTDTNARGNLAFAKLGDKADYVTGLAENFIALSSTSQKSEEALAFLTWLYSAQENYDLFHYGVKDKDYTLNEEGRITKVKGGYSASEALTGYRPYIRYGEKISDAYIEAVTKESEDAVIAESAYFEFDDSGLQEECRLLEAAVKKYIYPIKLGLKSYDENIGEAIAQLNMAGLQDYVKAYKKQYAAFLKGGEATPKPTAKPTVKPTAEPDASGEE